MSLVPGAAGAAASFPAGLVGGGNANIRASEGAGTTTLVAGTDNPSQVFNLSAARTVVLPTAGVNAGDRWTIQCQTDQALTLQSSGLNTIATIGIGGVIVEALVATPTTAANWRIVDLWSTGTVSSTFTFNGAGTTTAGVQLVYQRRGDWVTLFVPAFTSTNAGTSSTALTANTPVGSFARPLTTSQFAVVTSMKDNGSIAATPGRVNVSTAGIIVFAKDQTGSSTWANAAAAGPAASFAFSYFVGTGS